MCTLLLCSRVWGDLPLLVAANRDERLDRPASGPAVHARPSGRVLAPTDLLQGGTWLGVSARGVFAGLTNRAGAPPDPARRSRGELVFHALDGDDAADGAARVLALGAADHNPFHLFVADRAGAHLVWSDGASLRHEALPPGVHVLTERSLGAADPTRADALLAWARARTGDAPPGDDALAARLAKHDLARPLEAPCVHLPSYGYGTRSSTIVRLGDAPRALQLLHADGAPCTTRHAPADALVEALFAAPDADAGGGGTAG